jgi:hypothetical protein
MVQARNAQAAALEKGGALEEMALERLAAEVEAGRSVEGQRFDGFVETTETKTFIDGLKAEDNASAAAIKVVKPLCSLHSIACWLCCHA